MIEKIGKYEIHPAASVFPLLCDTDPEEWAAMVESVQNEGIHNPIVLFLGQVIDGRNRLKACLECDPPIDPPVTQMTKYASPWCYVYSANMTRRHMTKDQRIAAVTLLEEASLKNADEKRPRGRPKKGEELNETKPSQFIERNKQTRELLAERAQVGIGKAQQALNVLGMDGGDALLKDVASGKTTLTKALPKKEEAKVKTPLEKALDAISKLSPSDLEQVRAKLATPRHEEAATVK